MTATIHQLPRRSRSPASATDTPPIIPVDAFCSWMGSATSVAGTQEDAASLAAHGSQIMIDLCVFASRHGLPQPSDEALLFDAEAIASWPPHLWREAFRTLWQTWTYRRMPTVGDFRAVIAADLTNSASTSSCRSAQANPRDPADGAACGSVIAQTEAPMTAEASVRALQSVSATAPGLVVKWWKAACKADPSLRPTDFSAIERWAPVVAQRIDAVGLLGPAC